IAINTAQGDLSFGDLLRQYNDSRTFFSHVITAISTQLLDWNLKAEMYFNMLLAGMTLIVLIGLYHCVDPQFTWVMILPFSWLVFSLMPHVNWLWAIQSVYFFSNLFFVLMLSTIVSFNPGMRPLLLAGIFALCATFSFANGLLTWLVLLVAIWLFGYRQWRYYLFWVLMMGASLAVYFNGYLFRPGNITATTFNPVSILGWVIVFVGSPLTNRAMIAETRVVVAFILGILGVCVVCINLLYLKRVGRGWDELASWGLLALFVVLSGAVAGVNRMSVFGIDGAIASRYLTLNTLFWVAVVALIALTLRTVWHRSDNPAPLLKYANLVVLVVLASVFFYSTLESLNPALPIPPEARACAEAYPQTQDTSCLVRLHPAFNPNRRAYETSFEIIKNRLDEVVAYRLALYADSDD
ncbi:MAG: hypothetical protein D6737_09870, partial [Chloroflexi bacterium]